MVMVMMFRRAADLKKEAATCDRDVTLTVKACVCVCVVAASGVVVAASLTEKFNRSSVRKAPCYPSCCMLLR